MAKRSSAQSQPLFADLLAREMTRKEFIGWSGLLVASIFGLGGVIELIRAHAATLSASAESEGGTVSSPAAVITDSTASGGKAVKFTQPTSGGTNPGGTTNIYRPYSISSPTQLPHAPKDANYVNWNSLGVTYIDQAFNKLGANDILVLPERSAPYEIDSSKGFTQGWYSMTIAKRGLVGLGPGVIVQPSASSYTSGQMSFGGGGSQTRIITCEADGAYFANFEMRGRDFGGVQYDGINGNGNDTVWERIYFNGAHRGFKAAPDGECGALAGLHGTNQQVYNVEVDCRDPATQRPVGTSPFMFNNQSNVTVVDFYGHHAYAGMPTFWEVTNITTTRLRSEYNGNGPIGIGGAGINHELVAGTVTHNNPTLIVGSQNPSAAHISIGTDKTDAQYYINNPTFDASWDGAGILTVDIWPYPGGISQSNSGIHVLGAPFRIHH